MGTFLLFREKLFSFVGNMDSRNEELVQFLVSSLSSLVQLVYLLVSVIASSLVSLPFLAVVNKISTKISKQIGICRLRSFDFFSGHVKRGVEE